MMNSLDRLSMDMNIPILFVSSILAHYSCDFGDPDYTHYNYLKHTFIVKSHNRLVAIIMVYTFVYTRVHVYIQVQNTISYH